MENKSIKQKRILGVGLGLYLLLMNLVMVGYQLVVEKSGILNESNTELLYYIGNAISVYVVGIVTLKLLFRKIERVVPTEKSDFKFGKILYLIMITIGLGIGCTFITNVVKLLIEQISDISIGNRVADMLQKSSPAIMIFFVAILAPICEEVIFRGIFLSRLRAYGDKTAIIYTAILFGLFHTNFMQIPMAIAIGLVLGYAVVKTNKLRYSIILHMVMNLISSILTILLQNEQIVIAGLISMIEMGFALATVISLPILLTSSKHKLNISNETKYDRKKLYFNIGYIFSVIIVVLITVLAIVLG